MTLHIKQYAISNIVLNNGKNISVNDYRTISTIDKNAENWYDFVKCKSYSYTLQSYYKIARDVIKAG